MAAHTPRRLHLLASSAKNLKAADSNGLSDPFCAIALTTGNASVNTDCNSSNSSNSNSNSSNSSHKEEQEVTQKRKTRVHRKTLNPVWNEQFSFDNVPHDNNAKLTVTVFDWDRIGKPDFLGTFSLSLQDVLVGTTEIERDFPLRDDPQFHKLHLHHLLGHDHHHQHGEQKNDNNNNNGITGSVHLVLQCLPADLPKPRLSPSAVAANAGVLFVSIVSGRKLCPKDSSGTSDPFARLKLKNGTSTSGKGVVEQPLEYRTSIVKKDLNPVWEEEFYFNVTECADGSVARGAVQLEISVADWNLIGHDTPMGHVVVDISSLSDGRLVDSWLALIPAKHETVSGDIHVRLQYTNALMAQKQAKIAEAHYSKFIRMLTFKGSIIASALCQVCDSNDAARALVFLFDSEARITSLLNMFAFVEIRGTVQEETLFRGNSAATKVFVEYLKLAGGHWLHQTLAGLVESVLQDPTSYEVDPALLGGDTETAQHNVERLLQRSAQFLDEIFAQSRHCPAGVRLAFSNLSRLVASKFPTSTLRAVGAFVFLRFLVPAIAVPEGYKIVREAPSKEGRRALTLISKVIQNVANQVQVPKEEYLAPLQPLVTSYSVKLQRCFESFSSVERNTVAAPVHEGASSHEAASALVDQARVRELATLVRFLSIHLERVEQQVLAEPRLVGEVRDQHVRLLAELKALLH